MQKLDGGVSNTHRAAICRRPRQDFAGIGLHCNVEVGGQERHTGLECPHVQIMHAQHSRNLHRDGMPISNVGLGSAAL